MALITVAAALALSPGLASAAQTYYVAPAGTGSACTQAEPCSLSQVLATPTTSGDKVVLAGNEGTYGSAGLPTSAGIDIPAGVTWTGAPDQSMPIIYSQPSSPSVAGVSLEGSGSKLTDLDIEYSGNAAALSAKGGSVERVLALSGLSGDGCNLASGPLVVRDSVCSGRNGLFTEVVGSGPESLTLRNDTVYGNAESGYSILTDGVEVTISATNTIIHSEGTGQDIAAKVLTGSIDFGLEYSNYAHVSKKGGAVVTDPGSATNQIAPPFFVDAAADDFREAGDSPTIDAGVNESANGETDLAGNPRALPGHLACGQEPPPAITDIGAYEFVPVAPPCVPPPGNEERPPHAPNTRIIGVRVRHHVASFRFNAARITSLISFQCELAEEPFRPCNSPKTYTHLKPGTYRFTVRAVGQPGGIDLTPAVRSFRIRPRG
ncbi:MAG TPA: hypothetical protein VND98_10820 [Solirubrobacterales bacterium]|nr:hypothetical protein [Solirubrobacterales bacterium]